METEIFVTDSIIEAKQIQEILTAHNIPNYLKTNTHRIFLEIQDYYLEKIL